MGWASQQLQIQNAEVAAGTRRSVDVGLAGQAAQEAREEARAEHWHRVSVEKAAEEQAGLQREALAQGDRHARASQQAAQEALRQAEDFAREQRDFQWRMEALERDRAEEARAHNERLLAEMEHENERNEAHRSSMRALERERIDNAKRAAHLTNLRLSPSYLAATRLLELMQLEWPIAEHRELEDLLAPAVALNKRLTLRFNAIVTPIVREQRGKLEELETLFKEAYHAERTAVELQARNEREAASLGLAWFGQRAKRRRELAAVSGEIERQITEANSLTLKRRRERDEYRETVSEEPDLVRALFKANCKDEMERLEAEIVSWFHKRTRSRRLISFLGGKLRNTQEPVVDIELCSTLDDLCATGVREIAYPGIGPLSYNADLGGVVARIHALRGQSDPFEESPAGWSELLWLALAREDGVVGTDAYFGRLPALFVEEIEFNLSGEPDPNGGKGFFSD